MCWRCAPDWAPRRSGGSWSWPELARTAFRLRPLLPFVPAGTVRILATASNGRLALAPDVPTFAEAGLAGIVAEPWYGIVAPAGTPAAVIAELSAALHAALSDEDIRRRFADLGYEAIVESPEAFAVAIRSEAEQARGSRQP